MGRTCRYTVEPVQSVDCLHLINLERLQRPARMHAITRSIACFHRNGRLGGNSPLPTCNAAHSITPYSRESSLFAKMPATDSPAIIVARFLKSSNYTEVSWTSTLALDIADQRLKVLL